MMKPLVSIIITTKNEENYLEPCLRSVKNQSYPNVKIIVTDACSTDNTVKIAKKYADRVIRKKTNIPEGLNLGASQANGEILVFGKADVIFSPMWIENAVTLLQNNEGVVAIYGRIKSSESGIRAKILEKLFNIMLYIYSTINSHKPLRKIRILNSFIHYEVLAVKKKIFDGVGKFDESLALCEDKEIMMRLMKRGEIIFQPKNVSYASFRRFEKEGYIKLLTVWIINYIYFAITKKNIFKSYTRE